MQVNQDKILKIAPQPPFLIQSFLKEADLEFLQKTVLGVSKAIAPVLKIVQSESFQTELNHINKIVNDLLPVIERHRALTISSIQKMQDVYREIDIVSHVFVPTSGIFSEEDRELIVTRPMFNNAKSYIRDRVSAVKEILPLSLPPDVVWEDVRAKFIDGENIFIEIPKYKIKFNADYHDMGMCDARSNNPNSQWKVLYELAKYDGEISWNTPVANYRIKKQKQLLSGVLKRYFNVKGEPFGSYRLEKAYRLKMNLISDQDLERENSDDLDEYFSEATPQIYKRDFNGIY